MASRRRHPFRDLRGRDHITFSIDPIADEAGGAIYGRLGDRAVIILSPRLSPEAQACALAHELWHDEFGVTSPPATEATMERIEAMVRRRTAEGLVPADELLALVLTRVEVEPIDATVVAIEFGVTEEVATVALVRLQAELGERARAS